MANLLAAGRKTKSVSMVPMVPAKRRRRKPVAVKATPKRRRRKKPGMLSANGSVQTLLMQGALAIAGGMAGKIARNFMPQSLSPYLQAGIVSAGGIAVAYFTKQPMLGAGMIGSAGASIAANIGKDYNVPILKEQGNASFVRLQENGRDQYYADQFGNPLQKVGSQFFDSMGRLTPFKESDFKSIN